MKVLYPSTSRLKCYTCIDRRSSRVVYITWSLVIRCREVRSHGYVVAHTAFTVGICQQCVLEYCYGEMWKWQAIYRRGGLWLALKTVDVVLWMMHYCSIWQVVETWPWWPIENQSFLVLLRILQSMWEYVNNAFWDISMARSENDKAFIEEEDCDWPWIGLTWSSKLKHGFSLCVCIYIYKINRLFLSLSGSFYAPIIMCSNRYISLW